MRRADQKRLQHHISVLESVFGIWTTATSGISQDVKIEYIEKGCPRFNYISGFANYELLVISTHDYHNTTTTSAASEQLRQQLRRSRQQTIGPIDRQSS
ncbi:hypothetical protein VTL71DRAFT_5081 [Oculimacula yallundae]|uniref:Uncharacterized protein n=1 Tax=Oculimacula yallundae TaxID=86028 RepID=A0ABR4C1A5_9HELO